MKKSEKRSCVMKEEKNILILYANYGEGHKRAAKAIEEKLKINMKNVNIHVEDFLGESYPLSDWIMRKLYLQTFTWAEPIYHQFYYKTKDASVDSAIFSMPSTLGSLKLERHLKKLKPSIVISTFPTLTGMLAKVKERAHFNFKLYCVLTDYVVHSQWLYHAVDRYFVPNDKIRRELIDRGIHESTIKITGIPVMPHFEHKYEKTDLKKKWGLTLNKPVVLLSAGAFGVVNIKEACQRLVETCPDIQFVVVCGRNKKLYKQLQDIPAIRPLPFIKEMHELMQLADLFVTKAGGLSVSEAITSEVPMVLFKSLSGQETENVKYLLRERVAKRVKSPDQLVNTVSDLIRNKDQLELMKKHIKILNQKLSLSYIITDTVSNEIERVDTRPKPIKIKNEKLYEVK